MNRDIVVGLKFRKTPDFDVNEIAEMFEKGYLAQRRPSGKVSKKTTFAPSTIGYGHGNCARYWFLAFTGGIFQDDIDAMSVAVMANGTHAHERLQKSLEMAGTLVASEVEVKLADPPVRGYLDAMVRMPNGEVVIGEFKTTRSESFVFKEATGKPSANHLIQLLIYLKATGKKRGFLLYENRNTLEVVIIPVEMNETNEALLEETLEWLRTVYKAWEEGKIPNPAFTPRNYVNEDGVKELKHNKVCLACPVFDICWNDPRPGDIQIRRYVLPAI